MVLVGEFVGGALLGAVFGELLKIVVDTTKNTKSFKSRLKHIEFILRSIIPIIKEIDELNKVLDRPKEETAKLMEIINKGNEVVSKCSKVRRWQCHKKAYYASKLMELEKSLHVFFQIVMQAQQTRDIKETALEVKDLRMDIKRLSRNENFGGGGYEPVDVQFMGSSALPGAPPTCTIELDMPLMELKMELFKDGVSVIVLTAPGRCGKNTLANMLFGGSNAGLWNPYNCLASSFKNVLCDQI